MVKSFDELNLREPLLRGIYAYGFEEPSAIQQRAIKPCILGKIKEHQFKNESTIDVSLFRTWCYCSSTVRDGKNGHIFNFHPSETRHEFETMSSTDSSSNAWISSTSKSIFIVQHAKNLVCFVDSESCIDAEWLHGYYMPCLYRW